MNVNRILFVFFIVGFLLLNAPSSICMPSNGWHIVEKREDRFGNFSVQSTFISGQLLRIENFTSAYIFDMEKSLTTIIFPKQMVFWSGHHDSLREALFSAMGIQIQMMISQLPENEREGAELEFGKMLAELRNPVIDSLLPANFHILKTDSVSRFGGFLCQKYVFKFDTLALEELWITSEVKPYAGIDMQRLNRMMRIFSKPTLLSVFRETNEWLYLIQHGLVMRSVIPVSIGRSTMQVEKVQKTNIPLTFFEPPENYRGIGMEEVIRIIMGEEDAIKLDNETNRPILPGQKSSPLPPFPPGVDAGRPF